MHAYNFKDLTGQKFGRLTVIGFKARVNRQSYWNCKCDCGVETQVIGSNLKRGRIQSCGCLRVENSTTHGLAKIPEYKVWNSMVQRCGNPNDKGYKDYGGRGISVCEFWLKFENFIADMGERPSSKHSIDRLEVNGNYEHSNCQWSTTTEQARNKRSKVETASGYRGVHLFKATGKYQAHIRKIGGTRIHLGYFDKIEDAIKARENAEIEYWGKSS